MSSAANDKRGKLEEEFRSRIYDAEASPSQDLWARIDHSLTVQENSDYKKRMVFYRQLAAACIALLLLVGGAGAYYFGAAPATEPSVASVSPATNDVPNNQGNKTSATEKIATIAAADNNMSQDVAAVSEAEDATANREAVEHTAVAAVVNPSERSRREGTTGDAESLSTSDNATTAATEVTLAIATPQAGNLNQRTEEPQPTLYKSLRQTIASTTTTEQSNLGAAHRFLAQSATTDGATNDFRKQNELVMARARQQEEAQKAQAIAHNDAATTGTKKSEKESRGDKGRWALGMAYAPSYFAQNIGVPNQMVEAAASRQGFMSSDASTAALSSLYMNEAREEYEENIDPGFSYGIEVKSGFRLGKKLKLLTGLGYLQNTARSKSSYVAQQHRSDVATPVFLPSISAETDGVPLMVAKTSEYNVNYRYRYLTVPVGLQYEGNMGKEWFWYGGAGVAANVLLQTTILASSSDVKDEEYGANDDSPFRKLQWSGNVLAGVGKRVANNISVTLGPEVRGYFTTLLADADNSQAKQGKPHTIGLNMGVNYELSGRKKSQ